MMLLSSFLHKEEKRPNPHPAVVRIEILIYSHILAFNMRTIWGGLVFECYFGGMGLCELYVEVAGELEMGVGESGGRMSVL